MTATFLAMNAEAMSFEDNKFDLVYGRGILHHLDVDRCFSEVVRVLKPNGVASRWTQSSPECLQKAGHPFIRTADEHPLLVSEFALARRYFRDVQVEYFGLCSVGSALMPRSISETMPE